MLIIVFRLLILFVPISARTLQRETQLPHCSHNSVMEGRIQDSSADGAPANVSGSIQFHMSLHETACIKLEVNRSLPGHVGLSSILHTVEFLRLEHHYSIAGKYKFAIPSISVDCKCDCAGGDSICSLKDFSYKFVPFPAYLLKEFSGTAHRLLLSVIEATNPLSPTLDV